MDKLEDEVKVLKQTLAVVTKQREDEVMKVVKQTMASIKSEVAQPKHIDACVEQDMQAFSSQVS